MKRKRDSDNFWRVPEVKVPRFGSGEVATILDVELWQLNRFLSRYELKSSGQLGEGQGSRRLYTTEDIYRIMTAMFLIKDGFAPKLVAQIMQRLEDTDFYGGHNERGDFSDFGVSLTRGEKGPVVNTFRADAPPKISMDSNTYYALSLSSIAHTVDRRIESLKKN